MAELHPSLVELLESRERIDYAHGKLLSAARALENEGMKTKYIAEGLLKTLLSIAPDMPGLDDYNFRKHACETLQASIDDIERAADELQEKSFSSS